MEEETNPRIINGTIKKMSCPRMYFTVTTTFIKPSPTINPKRIPIRTASNNLKIVLFRKWIISLKFFDYFVIYVVKINLGRKFGKKIRQLLIQICLSLFTVIYFFRCMHFPMRNGTPVLCNLFLPA